MNPCELKLSNELHSLIAEFRAFRELMFERDIRYMGMFASGDKAVSAALAAQKELTNGAFASSEKAIVKAEEAQKSYNASHNDLARKMDDQNKATMPRTETESRFGSIEEKINDLREGRSVLSGKEQAVAAQAVNARWLVGLVIAVLLNFLGTAIALGTLMLKGQGTTSPQVIYAPAPTVAQPSAK